MSFSSTPIVRTASVETGAEISALSNAVSNDKKDTTDSFLPQLPLLRRHNKRSYSTCTDTEELEFVSTDSKRMRTSSSSLLSTNYIAYKGAIVHSLGLNNVERISKGMIVIDQTTGTILDVINCEASSALEMNAIYDICGGEGSSNIIDFGNHLIIPGFIDTHAHAPQYKFTGTGMNLPLLKWLEKYTFPCESNFKDLNYAADVYSKSVKRHMAYGTTSCSYFGTLHLEASKLLADIVEQFGQRGFIGKVSMDRNSPDYYVEYTDDAVRNAREFVNYCIQKKEKIEEKRKRKEEEQLALYHEKYEENNTCQIKTNIHRITSNSTIQTDSCICTDDSSLDTNLDVTIQNSNSDNSDDDTNRRKTTILMEKKIESSDKNNEHVASIDIEKKYKAVLDNTEIIPLITPVITPRFVPSCTSKLLKSLGDISHEFQLPVQSHLNESIGEIEWVKSLHPECESYADVYMKHGLMHERSYFAHCVHCTKNEHQMYIDSKSGVSHCPSSNFMLGSGICNVRKLLRKGIKVGLGTDVAGGYSCSMLDAMRQAMIASRAISFQEKDEDGKFYKPLNYCDAFHLATQGGADLLGIGQTVGNFTPGKQFDALIVDPICEHGPLDVFHDEDLEESFEKFIFLGDDRNIERVFVSGKEVVNSKNPFCVNNDEN